MKRKAALALSALFIVLDIGVGAAVYQASAQRLSGASAGIAAVIEMLREYIRPIPTL